MLAVTNAFKSSFRIGSLRSKEAMLAGLSAMVVENEGYTAAFKLNLFYSCACRLVLCSHFYLGIPIYLGIPNIGNRKASGRSHRYLYDICALYWKRTYIAMYRSNVWESQLNVWESQLNVWESQLNVWESQLMFGIPNYFVGNPNYFVGIPKHLNDTSRYMCALSTAHIYRGSIGAVFLKFCDSQCLGFPSVPCSWEWDSQFWSRYGGISA
jgi:hypothetical protein